jgi:hypothetical protein
MTACVATSKQQHQSSVFPQTYTNQNDINCSSAIL